FFDGNSAKALPAHTRRFRVRRISRKGNHRDRRSVAAVSPPTLRVHRSDFNSPRPSRRTPLARESRRRFLAAELHPALPIEQRFIMVCFAPHRVSVTTPVKLSTPAAKPANANNKLILIV